jgi:hypothetical protein
MQVVEMDSKLVARITRNPILKGLRVRNDKNKRSRQQDG